MPNPGMGSYFRVPEDATGDARLYGTFPNQSLMGKRCTIITAKLNDFDSGCLDVFGLASFHRGGTAIHISGYSEFGGANADPGRVVAMATYSVDWLGAKNHCSGLGCDGPEAAVIVQHIGEPTDHHALFGGSTAFVTLHGLVAYARQINAAPFNGRDVCEWIDAIEAKRRSWKLGKNNVAAMNRLCRAGYRDGALVVRGRHKFAVSAPEQSGNLNTKGVSR